MIEFLDKDEALSFILIDTSPSEEENLTEKFKRKRTLFMTDANSRRWISGRAILDLEYWNTDEEKKEIINTSYGEILYKIAKTDKHYRLTYWETMSLLGRTKAEITWKYENEKWNVEKIEIPEDY